ncbi:hypothetical protein HZ326_26614 [Fusarium oxysporum f. sp. albedinis]|nr:hypothetical protein HZ326_26614 [Fusarium oxysporum f. sp. albedinis]
MTSVILDKKLLLRVSLCSTSFCELQLKIPCSDMDPNSDGSGITNNPVAWPNGKASDYESEDSGFDPQRDHILFFFASSVKPTRSTFCLSSDIHYSLQVCVVPITSLVASCLALCSANLQADHSSEMVRVLQCRHFGNDKDLGTGHLLSMVTSESVPGSKPHTLHRKTRASPHALFSPMQHARRLMPAASEHALVILPLTDIELEINMSLDMASPAADNEKHLGSQNQDEQNLERHGYVQQTKRNFSLTAMVATCVNLMATWEALSSTLAAGLVSGGPVSLVYGVIVAFIGSLCSASSLAELASSYPTAGGQYHFVAKLSPKTSRPLTSWFAGYISTLGWIASAGSAPFLAGTQIQGLLVLNYPDSYVFQRWHGTLLFWAVLLGSACICIFCSNKLPLIEKLTLVLHVTFFIAIIVTMAVTSPTNHSAEWVFSHFENNSGWGNNAVAWSIGLLSSCYVLIGYDGATHLSEEMNNAEMGVPRAMVGCLLVNGPLGFAFLLIILFFMGDISAALATPTGFPIIEIFLHMTGSVAAATTMTAMITVMACLSTVPLLTAAARIMWAFARDGGLPFAERIASVDKRRQIPTVSIVVVSFLLMLLSLINIGSTTAFNAILSLAVVSLQASYLLPILLLIWRRLFRPDTLRWGPWRLGRAGLPINVIAVIYLMYTCIFLLFPPFQPITPVNMNYAPVVLGGALVFGCFYWPLRVSKRYVGPLTDAEVLEGTLH